MARASEKREDGESGARRTRKLPRFSRKVFHRKRRGAQGARSSRSAPKPRTPLAEAHAEPVEKPARRPATKKRAA